MPGLIDVPTPPEQFEDPRAVLQSYWGYAHKLTGRYERMHAELGFAGLGFTVEFTCPGEIAEVERSIDPEGGVGYRFAYSNVPRNVQEAAEWRRQRQRGVRKSHRTLVTPEIQVGAFIPPVIPEEQPDSVLRDHCSAVEYAHRRLTRRPDWRAVGKLVALGHDISITYGDEGWFGANLD